MLQQGFVTKAGYIKYLEGVVLSLLAERKTTGDIPAIDQPGCTYAVVNIMTAVEKERDKLADPSVWQQLI